MNTGIVKIAGLTSVVAITCGFVYFSYSHPWYFTSQTYLAGLLFLEILVGAIWLYRTVFFPLVMVTFLLAGVDLPVGSGWTMARWLVLAVGALVGSTIMLRERRYSFGAVHVLALFAILAALMSAAVSRYPAVSSLKVLSLLLLFVYGATGARVAVSGREGSFFTGLLASCEVLVAVIAGFYLLGVEVMGNPNSLGAVMGVVAAPVLLWGSLLRQGLWSHRRRMLLFSVAVYLTFFSQARAGILVVLISCGLLCLVMRKFALLIQGIGIMAVLIATSAIVQPEVFSSRVAAFTSTIVYKGKDPAQGLLGSRTSPWQDTVNTIHDHFWFGTGFGTSDSGQDQSQYLGKFASSAVVSSEHGSSYLEILSWTGMLGVLPFVLLLALITKRTLDAIVWMTKTSDPYHPVVPLSILMVGSLLHAAVEDWLFAPGYYLCAFYWSMAFVFVDQIRTLPSADGRSILQAHHGKMPRETSAIALGR